MISQGETAELIRVLHAKQAQLLHIYFGHIGVHLMPLIGFANSAKFPG